MKMIKKLIPISMTLAPLVAFGAAVTDIGSLISVVGDILARIAPLLIGVAVIIFLVGVIRYITAGEDAEKRTAGRNMMIYGIIGLFVMVSVWGLVNVLKGTFDFNQSMPIEIGGQIPIP